MRIHLNIQQKLHLKSTQKLANQQKYALSQNQSMMPNTNTLSIRNHRITSKTANHHKSIQPQNNQLTLLDQKQSNTAAMNYEKVGVSPHKKYSKLTTFLKQCESGDFAQQKNHNDQHNQRQGKSRNESSKGFSEWHNKINQRNIKKDLEDNDDSQNLTNQQLGQISLNFIKDPSKNIYFPLALQIKLSKNSNRDISENQRKLQIKEKIKGRVKQQIHHLIKRHGLHKNKEEPKRSLCFRPDILNEQILIKNPGEFEKYEQEMAKIENNQLRSIRTPQNSSPTRRDSILAELPFTSRKVRSSLDHRSHHRPISIRVNKLHKRKSSDSQIDNQLIESVRNHYKYQSYKRSYSTDVRNRNRKFNNTTNRLSAKDKESQEIQPWIINNLEEEQQNF